MYMGRSSPEHRSKYADQYRHTPSGRAARKRAQDRYYGSDKWREAHRRGVAAYRARSRERAAAHYAVTDAIQAGKLRVPPTCESCGDPGTLAGHHHRGYTGDARLDVIWLCRGCHVVVHPLGKPKKVRPLGTDPSDIE